MQKLKQYRVLVVAVLLVFGFALWRLSRPSLKPEQQIRANMNGVAQAMQNTAPRAILGYLVPDFKWNSQSRDEIERVVREAAISATKVEVKRYGEKISVRGDSATVTGDFSISFRMLQESRETPPHVSAGQYTVLWQKQADGDWKISSVQGGENTGGF